MASEHPGGDRMESAEPRHPLDRAPTDLAHALLHLARGLVGEGDGEDLARPGFPSRDEMGESGGQRGRLSRAGTRKDEHWTLGCQHGFALGRIQALQIGWGGMECRGFRHLAEVGQRERNGNRSTAFKKGSKCCSRYPRYPQACYQKFCFRDSNQMCMVTE